MSEDDRPRFFWLYVSATCGSSIRRERDIREPDPAWEGLRCPYCGGILVPFLPAGVTT